MVGHFFAKWIAEDICLYYIHWGELPLTRLFMLVYIVLFQTLYDKNVVGLSGEWPRKIRIAAVASDVPPSLRWTT